MANDDASLVKRTLDGDGEAYRVLVERHHGAVFACAWQLTGSRDEAEEAAQEAFVQAYAKLHALREPARFLPWTWRICTTVTLKARGRARRVPAGLETDGLPAADEPDRLVSEERDRELRAALAALPEEQRLPITLRFWDGMGYEQMAEMLGVSLDALYQRVSRGLRRLREVLGGDEL